MNNRFSENLKKIRKDHNLSQEQLAEELGVSRQAISKWESGAAYPEMDKIIALCDKFQLNIDDLLHKDVKEVKGEDESKKKINHYVDGFLSFITDSVNLFSSMTFKSKIKCILEQCFIALILFLASRAVISILDNFTFDVIQFLPDLITIPFNHLLHAIFVLFCFIASIVIMVHLFKTRYLDYYTNHKEEKMEEVNSSDEPKKEEKIDLKKDESKIIIRDPKHSEYGFINGLFKILVYFIKFFALCFLISLCFVLVFLFCGLVLSFLVFKTGLFFLGILLTVLSSAGVTIILMCILLNFVFNRKGNKKVMIFGFIASVIFFGIGCGMIFKGTLNFELVPYDNSMNQTITTEHDMRENYILFTHDNYEVQYVESDNDNIKIEYSINKYCEVEEFEENDGGKLNAWTSCHHPMKMIKETLKIINDKKLIYFSQGDINTITVTSTPENIQILKENRNRYFEEVRQIDFEREEYENTIDELENKNDELNDQVDNLNDQIEDLKESLRECHEEETD